MEAHYFYLFVGIVLCALEMLVPGFVLLPLGVAFIGTATIAWFSASFVVHALGFCVCALICFFLVARWNGLKAAAPKSPLTTGPVGQVGTLIEAAVSPELPGRVRVFGDTWDLLWPDGDDGLAKELAQLAVGARVRITAVIGNRVRIVPLSAD